MHTHVDVEKRLTPSSRAVDRPVSVCSRFVPWANEQEQKRINIRQPLPGASVTNKGKGGRKERWAG